MTESTPAQPNPADSNDDPSALQQLDAFDAVVRRSKAGRVLSVSFEGNASIGDTEIEFLTGLGRLRELNLSDTGIGNDCIATLRQLPRLQTLDVRGARVGDPFAEFLPQFKQLKLVDLSQTDVSVNQVRSLRKRMIGTRIVHLG